MRYIIHNETEIIADVEAPAGATGTAIHPLVGQKDEDGNYLVSVFQAESDVQYEMHEGKPRLRQKTGWKIQNGRPVPCYSEETEIEAVRIVKCRDIDDNTQALIAEGFGFDGKQFSLSANAQAKIADIEKLADKDLLDPKTPLSTKDDEVYLLKKADAMNFVAAAYHQKYQVAVIPGTLLKGQIKTMTLAQLETFTDARMA